MHMYCGWLMCGWIRTAVQLRPDTLGFLPQSVLSYAVVGFVILATFILLFFSASVFTICQ